MAVGRNVHAGQAVSSPLIGMSVFWSFDQCSKLENRQLRQELQDVAAEAGCKFHCAKKAVDFLSWLGCRKETVLLLADWREAKVIQEELRDTFRHDMRFCVVAPSVKAFTRSSTWARRHHAADIVVMSGTWLQGAKALMQRKKETPFPCRGGGEDFRGVLQPHGRA